MPKKTDVDKAIEAEQKRLELEKFIVETRKKQEAEGIKPAKVTRRAANKGKATKGESNE